MVSPDEPSPIKKVDPSPVKKVEEFGSSLVTSMAEKAKPPPDAFPEPMEVRSFDDESAVSSIISAFSDVLTRAGSVAAAVGFVEEKKETDSVASVRLREIPRVKSVNTHITDVSNRTQFENSHKKKRSTGKP